MDITDYFECEIKYDYIYSQFINEMYPETTEGSASVMTSRLKKAFESKKLTPTCRAFLIYLKYSNKYPIERTSDGKQ